MEITATYLQVITNKLDLMKIVKATVEKIEDFQKDEMKDALKHMGFDYLEMNFYRRVELDGDLVIYGELYDDGILITVYENNKEIKSQQFTSAVRFIDFVEHILQQYEIEYVEIIDPDELVIGDKGVITSATRIYAKGFNRHDNSKRNKTTTRDFAQQLKQVDSSNVWAYAFQPKDDKNGDLLMQFKDKKQYPERGGDIYIYYNVPNKLWHRLYLAESKGGFFWQFIRNVFTYAKLTGDKRTHLPNGI